MRYVKCNPQTAPTGDRLVTVEGVFCEARVWVRETDERLANTRWGPLLGCEVVNLALDSVEVKLPSESECGLTTLLVDLNRSFPEGLLDIIGL